MDKVIKNNTLYLITTPLKVPIEKVATIRKTPPTNHTHGFQEEKCNAELGKREHPASSHKQKACVHLQSTKEHESTKDTLDCQENVTCTVTAAEIRASSIRNGFDVDKELMRMKRSNA